MLFRSHLQLYCQLLGICIYRKCAFRHFGNLWVEGEGGCAAIYSNLSAVGAEITAKIHTAFKGTFITNSTICFNKITIGLG